MIHVFRSGKIYEYDEIYGCATWSKEQFFIASSLYASLKHLNYSNDEAYSLSYMYVSKENDPELEYENIYSNTLKKVFNLLEKA